MLIYEPQQIPLRNCFAAILKLNVLQKLKQQRHNDEGNWILCYGGGTFRKN